MKYIKLYEEYKDEVPAEMRDLFGLKETITLKDVFGNKIVFEGPPESFDVATEITSKATSELNNITSSNWNRNQNQVTIDDILISIRKELKEIGWEITKWYGGSTPEERADGRVQYGGGIQENNEDPLDALGDTADLFSLVYKRDLETGGFSGDYYIEGLAGYKSEADDIADWIENELHSVRNEYDDLENGEGEALDQVDIRWNEIKDSEELADRLSEIGYKLKKYED